MQKTEKPIIICQQLIPPTLDGRKTVTRRVIKEIPAHYKQAIKPKSYGEHDYAFVDLADPIGTYPTLASSRYQVGDILWVKETWQHECLHCDNHLCGNPDHIYHKAGLPGADTFAKWRSSRFMPKFAARIWREVIDVRPERLQEITVEEIKKEGITSYIKLGYPTFEIAFIDLWDSLNAKRGYPWEMNPWVWRYEFKRTKTD